jgi:hypothetical protein
MPTSINLPATSARMNAKFFIARTDLLWGSMLAERKARVTPRRLGTFSPRRTPQRIVAHGYGNVERRIFRTAGYADPDPDTGRRGWVTRTVHGSRADALRELKLLAAHANRAPPLEPA